MHGRPQAWAKGTCPPSPAGKCKVLFVLQMLSKVSVDEVFIHHFDKMSSASGGASPQTPTGVLPVDPAGGLPSFRSPHCLPLEKIFRVPMTERNVMHATSWHRGNDHVLRTELQIFTCIFNRSHFEQRSKWHSMTCV